MTVNKTYYCINELKEKLKQEASDKKIVCTNGCFDILHVGHSRYLTESKKLGDILVVGLNSDESVKMLNKGDDRPINSQEDRAELLAALKCVDYVGIFTEKDACNFLRAVEPQVYTKGGDYSEAEMEKWPEYQLAKELGTEIQLINFVKGKSSTKVINKLKQSALAILILLFSFMSFGLQAAKANPNVFKVSLNRKQIAQNETVNLTIEIIKNGFNIKTFPENTRDYRVVGRSSSSSYKNINGKSTSSRKYSYNFSPKHAGNMRIPKILISNNRENYYTQAVDIKVGPARGNRQQNNFKQMRNSVGNSRNKYQAQKPVKQIFARFEANKTNPYQNEQVNLKLKIYHRGNLRKLGQPNLQLDDFIQYPYDEAHEYRENYAGITYLVYEFQFILFPLDAGLARVSSTNFPVIIAENRGRNNFDPFDPFSSLSPFTSQREISLNIPELRLQVKKLPPGAPADFSGYVGELAINHKINKNTSTDGEAISINSNIYGDGNFNILTHDLIPESKQYSIYKDQEDTQKQISGKRMVFETNISSAIIPNKSDGRLVVKTKSITNFNPKTKRYESHGQQEFNINVVSTGAARTNIPGQADSTVTNGSVESRTQAAKRKAVEQKAINEILFASDAQIIDYQGNPIKSLWLFVTIAVINLLAFIVYVATKIQNGSGAENKANTLTKASKEIKAAANIAEISTIIRDLEIKITDKVNNNGINPEAKQSLTEIKTDLNQFLQKSDMLNYSGGMSDPQAAANQISDFKQQGLELLKKIRKVPKVKF